MEYVLSDGSARSGGAHESVGAKSSSDSCGRADGDVRAGLGWRPGSGCAADRYHDAFRRGTGGAFRTQPATASGTQPTCSSPGPGKPILITADCVDPRFNDPYIIEDTTVPAANATIRSVPVPYTYIHGGFRGTDATFSFYFPPASMYQGRFFQMNVHQLRTTGDSAAVPIPPPVIDEIDNNTSSSQNAELVFLQENEIGFAFNTGGYLVEASPNDEIRP